MITWKQRLVITLAGLAGVVTGTVIMALVAHSAPLPDVSLKGWMIEATITDEGETLGRMTYIRPGALFDSQDACQKFLQGDTFAVDIPALAAAAAEVIKAHPNAALDVHCVHVDTAQKASL